MKHIQSFLSYDVNLPELFISNLLDMHSDPKDLIHRIIKDLKGSQEGILYDVSADHELPSDSDRLLNQHSANLGKTECQS